jgi:hypothetical protein
MAGVVRKDEGVSMKRSSAALAVAVVAIFAVAGCNDYGNTFQSNTGALLIFLSPSQVSAGNGDFTLSIQGQGFVLQTVVQWNGKPLATTVAVDSTGVALGNVVTAKVPASLVTKPGVATILTKNPASGAGMNGLSNTIAFIINPAPNPTPALSSLSQNTAPATTSGSPPLPITLSGTNFLTNADPTQSSAVIWSVNGSQTKLAIGTISATSIAATITPDLLVNTGSSSLVASLTVSNPPSPPPSGCTISCTGGGGGGSSNALSFTICAAGQSSCPPAPSANKASADALVAEETPAVSLDGRYVSYTAVQNERAHIFLRDTCEGAASDCQPRTTLLSVAADGTLANDESHTPSMSSDGRFVAFSSAATNLVENAPSGRQIYLRDTCAGAANSCKPRTQLVSLDSNGALVGTESILPSVSSSGRFIAFLTVTPTHSANQASASLKDPASITNSGYRQVFIRDTCLGAPNCALKTTRISLQPGDGLGSAAKPAGPALSGNAARVAIAGGNAAAVFTRSVAVDDRVFLAIANQQH